MRTKLRRITSIAVAAVLGVSLVACDREESEKESENEGPRQTVSIEQVPAPVKTAILAQARGGEIQNIEKIDRQGKTIYDAHIKRNGLSNEVRVAEDGKILPAESKKDDD